jgi:hypothetical protein
VGERPFADDRGGGAIDEHAGSPRRPSWYPNVLVVGVIDGS